MDDSANTNIEVNQKAAPGSNATQIGQQINHYGLTPEQANQMAVTMFREYYPMLRQEALAEVSNIVMRELQKIPPADIQAPSPKITVPLLQNASITEEPNLREMYGKLLAGDMDKKRKSMVHPAYIEIINQMNSNDASIFHRAIVINNNIPLVELRFSYGSEYFPNAFPHYFCPYFPDIDPWKASISIENLLRLNLFKLVQGKVQNYDYDHIKQMPFVITQFEIAKQIDSSIELSIEQQNYVLQLNDFGRKFAILCF